MTDKILVLDANSGRFFYATPEFMETEKDRILNNLKEEETMENLKIKLKKNNKYDAIDEEFEIETGGPIKAVCFDGLEWRVEFYDEKKEDHKES